MLLRVFWSAGARKELPETAKRSEYSSAARVDRSGAIDGSWVIVAVVGGSSRLFRFPHRLS